jgi:molybdopterin/thiamine biosynthesis adenylyltransferase
MVNYPMESEIKKRAVPAAYPDGESYQSLSVSDVETLAESYRIDGRHVEIEALQHDVVPERYARNKAAFSVLDQIRLLESKVCIVGLGGLGGSVLEVLARVGVGSLVLIDGDRFEDSNLNRQLLSSHPRLGSGKADAAAQRVHEINPSVTIETHAVFVDRASVGQMIDGAGVVVDCLDNIQTRFVLESAAKAARIPMVSAAVAGGAGHIITIFPEDDGLSLVYGPPETAVEKGSETSLGCLPQAVSLLAALEGSETIKILLGKGSLLRNRLMIADLFQNSFDILQMS